MKVGKYTYGIQHIKQLWSQYGKLEIGAFCSIAENVTVFLAGNHSYEWLTTFPFGTVNKMIFNKPIPQGTRLNKSKCFDIKIGNDVWIAGGVTIMGGVTIGDGVVIARNSHVVKDIPPYAIVGGNPARVIKFRLSEENIKRMLKLKWWNLPDKTINKISPLLCSSDINRLLIYCKKIGVYNG